MKGGTNTCQRESLQHLSNNSMALQYGGHISLQQKLTITVNKNMKYVYINGNNNFGFSTIHVTAFTLGMLQENELYLHSVSLLITLLLSCKISVFRVFSIF